MQDAEDDDEEGRTRRVGFVLSEDFTEKEGRLQRRDTPHHLKNKRISSSSGKSAESEAEKVRRILAMVATGNEPSTSTTSDDADQRPSVKVVCVNLTTRSELPKVLFLAPSVCGFLLWSPYVIGLTIIFLPCGFFLSSIFFFLFLA